MYLLLTLLELANTLVGICLGVIQMAAALLGIILLALQILKEILNEQVRRVGSPPVLCALRACDRGRAVFVTEQLFDQHSPGPMRPGRADWGLASEQAAPPAPLPGLRPLLRKRALCGLLSVSAHRSLWLRWDAFQCGVERAMQPLDLMFQECYPLAQIGDDLVLRLEKFVVMRP